LPIAVDDNRFDFMILLKITINQKVVFIKHCVGYAWIRQVTASE